jgi:hypothetical protein
VAGPQDGRGAGSRGPAGRSGRCDARGGAAHRGARRVHRRRPAHRRPPPHHLARNSFSHNTSRRKIFTPRQASRTSFLLRQLLCIHRNQHRVGTAAPTRHTADRGASGGDPTTPDSSPPADERTHSATPSRSHPTIRTNPTGRTAVDTRSRTTPDRHITAGTERPASQRSANQRADHSRDHAEPQATRIQPDTRSDTRAAEAQNRTGPRRATSTNPRHRRSAARPNRASRTLKSRESYVQNT